MKVKTKVQRTYGMRTYVMKGALWRFFLLTNKMMCTFSVFHRNTLCLWGLTNILNAFPLQSWIFFRRYCESHIVLSLFPILGRFSCLSLLAHCYDKAHYLNQLSISGITKSMYIFICLHNTKQYRDQFQNTTQRCSWSQNTFNVVLLTHYTKTRWKYPINYVSGQLICNDGSRNITV